jgi:hypothetical protein
MPSKIIKITATTQEYLDNCDIWSFPYLAVSGHVEVLTGADILKLWQWVALRSTGEGTNYYAPLEEITPGMIDAYLGKET